MEPNWCSFQNSSIARSETNQTYLAFDFGKIAKMSFADSSNAFSSRALGSILRNFAVASRVFLEFTIFRVGHSSEFPPRDRFRTRLLWQTADGRLPQCLPLCAGLLRAFLEFLAIVFNESNRLRTFQWNKFCFFFSEFLPHAARFEWIDWTNSNVGKLNECVFLSHFRFVSFFCLFFAINFLLHQIENVVVVFDGHKQNFDLNWICRLELGQVLLCDCLLSIVVLCAINIICIIYILQTCIDSCRG